MFRLLSAPALALTGLLLAANPSAAQHHHHGGFTIGYGPGGLSVGYGRGGYYPGYYGYRSYYPGYYDPGYYGGTAYYYPVDPVYSYAPPPSAPSALPTPRTVAPSPADATALLTVKVPADADVWIGDLKMTQKGERRQFVSPSLEPGRIYQYEVRARWRENDRDIEKSQKVDFQAGERRIIDFLAPGP